jgi:hypothetical protein
MALFEVTPTAEINSRRREPQAAAPLTADTL